MINLVVRSFSALLLVGLRDELAQTVYDELYHSETAELSPETILDLESYYFSRLWGEVTSTKAGQRELSKSLRGFLEKEAEAVCEGYIKTSEAARQKGVTFSVLARTKRGSVSGKILDSLFLETMPSITVVNVRGYLYDLASSSYLGVVISEKAVKQIAKLWLSVLKAVLEELPVLTIDTALLHKLALPTATDELNNTLAELASVEEAAELFFWKDSQEGYTYWATLLLSDPDSFLRCLGEMLENACPDVKLPKLLLTRPRNYYGRGSRYEPQPKAFWEPYAPAPHELVAEYNPVNVVANAVAAKLAGGVAW